MHVCSYVEFWIEFWIWIVWISYLTSYMYGKYVLMYLENIYVMYVVRSIENTFSWFRVPPGCRTLRNHTYAVLYLT
jgi:hypothetical protein